MVTKGEDVSPYQYTDGAAPVVPASPKFDPEEAARRAKEEALRRQEALDKRDASGGRAG